MSALNGHRLDPPEHLPNAKRTGFPPSLLLSLLAAGSVLAGGLLLAVGLDYLGDDNAVHVPRWVFSWFAVLFIGAGVLLGVPALLRMRPVPRGPVWRRDKHWNPRGIGDDNARRLWGHFFALLGCSLFLAPFYMLWTALDLNEIRTWYDATVLIFPLMFGFTCLILAISFLQLLWRLLARLLYGRGRLHFYSFPYTLGGHFSARLELGHPLKNTPVSIELRCVQDRVVTRGSGEEERQEVQAFALYREQRPYTLNALGQAELNFKLPGNLPATNLRDHPAHYWEIVARAARKGPDFVAVFLIPVYN